MTEPCGSVYPRFVSNTDRGTREQPICADESGHPGTHSSASGIAWGEPNAPTWRTELSPPECPLLED